MDGAAWATARIAEAKAFAAAAFGSFAASTQSMHERAASSGFWSTAPGLFPGQVAYGDGGLPLFLGGVAVGAVGISGGTGAQDRACADAAAAALSPPQP